MEALAMIVGFVYAFLQIRKSHHLWYFCIAASVLNIIVFYHNNYPMMLAIQFFYIGNSFYGLKQFRKVKKQAVARYGVMDERDRDKVAVARFDPKVGCISSLIALAAFLVLAPIARSYALARGGVAFACQPWFDTLMGVGSMLGTFFLSRSYMCQWYMWLTINTLSTFVFLHSGMYFMTALYVAYVLVAAYGAWFWHKHGVYV